MLNLDEFPDNELTHPRLFCHAWVATAVIGAGLVGAGATIYSANKAASAQTSATDKATQAQMSIFNKTQENLSPFIEAGKTNQATLQDKLPFLTSPIVMDQANLEKTPGYQFNLTQGLKSTQNSAAGRGLAVSGAALKGAAAFATGLADSTYKTQYDIENTNRTNAFNRLKSLVDTGESAAAGQGVIGASTGKDIGGNIIGGGNAQAAGFNAAGQAINAGANNIGGYFAYKGLYGGGNNGSPGNNNSGVNPGN